MPSSTPPDAPAPVEGHATEARTPRTAVVAGATGLVGQALVDRLAESDRYDRVVALVRRAGPTWESPAVQAVRVDYEHLERTPLPFADADVYCALGTTIGAAGSRAAFRRVDVTYVVRLAVMAQAGGAAAFGLVSAESAHVDSLFFYGRCKGEAEAGVASVGLPSVTIARPSLLLGERETERRGERWAARVLRPLDRALATRVAGPLRRLRPIEADAVAAALVALVPRHLPGVRVYDADALRAIPSS